MTEPSEAVSRAKVLAFIDDSAAGAVLAAAEAVAPVLGAVVEAVHVIDESGGTVGVLAQPVDVPLRTLRGDPLELLVAASRADDVAAVVVGAGALPGRQTGHLSESLANHTVTPVLVVPPDARLTDRVRRVLIAMEGTSTNTRSLKATIELATDADLELVVVHVFESHAIPMFSDHPLYETEAYAKEFLARYIPGAPTARLELRVGVPVQEILNAADEAAPDLLAIGWHQSEDPTRGAVAHELLARSRIPILLVALQS